MHAQHFSTSPIKFNSIVQLNEFISKLDGIRIDAFNFTDIEAPEDERNLENLVLGKPLTLQVDVDKFEVVISGKGGLKYYDLNKLPKGFVGLPDVSDLMADVFNLDFYSNHKDTVITLTTIDAEGKSEQQIKLSDYHSKEACEARLASNQILIAETKQMIKKLNQSFDALKAESKKIQIALHQMEQETQLDKAS